MINAIAGSRMLEERQDNEGHPAVARLVCRYHHLGIPTSVHRRGERYLPHLNMYVSGCDTSPFGVEWMRFESDCQASELVRTTLHLAFEVDDLEGALEGRTVISDVGSPPDGVRVAMIIDHGAPIELMEILKHS